MIKNNVARVYAVLAPAAGFAKGSVVSPYHPIDRAHELFSQSGINAILFALR